MALSEGLSSKADFQEALQEAGESVTRIRKTYTDDDGNRIVEARIPARVLVEGVRLQEPTGVSNVAMSNVNNSNMQIIYMDPDEGEPWEDDIIERGSWRYKLSNLDFQPIDDVIIYYYANMVRVERARPK